MTPEENPFAPGAGTPPPELVGREDVLRQAEILFRRIQLGRPEKSMFLTGLRGVGKTVLLNRMDLMSQNIGCQSVFIEASEEKTMAEVLIPYLRQLLIRLSTSASAGAVVRRAFAVLKSFVGTVSLRIDDLRIGLDIEPELGTADSGDMDRDLPELFTAIAEAARDKQTAIAILIDEIQCFKKNELAALIMAMHLMQQRQLPLVFVGAGLPVLPGLIGNTRSYAERLFAFPDIGPLTAEAAAAAVRNPLTQNNVQINDSALDEIFNMTQGYPYFIQEWGYQVWNRAIDPIITEEIVKQTTTFVIKRLDDNFFRVRFSRLTPAEKRFLRAMANISNSEKRTSDVAAQLGVQLQSIGPNRAKLINKGMIYSPSYGNIAFTVPLFDEFIRREMPSVE